MSWDLTVPRALIIGAVIVGAAVFGSKLVAPYQMSNVEAADYTRIIWRLNTITGNIQMCHDDGQSFLAILDHKRPPPMTCE